MLHVYVFCCALDECGRENDAVGQSRSKGWTISQIACLQDPKVLPEVRAWELKT